VDFARLETGPYLTLTRILIFRKEKSIQFEPGRSPDRSGMGRAHRLGNGLLFEFPSVVAAVECAISVQELMSARN